GHREGHHVGLGMIADDGDAEEEDVGGDGSQGDERAHDGKARGAAHALIVPWAVTAGHRWRGLGTEKVGEGARIWYHVGRWPPAPRRRPLPPLRRKLPSPPPRWARASARSPSPSSSPRTAISSASTIRARRSSPA